MPDLNYTTFDLPNFIGSLFVKGKRENAMLQLVGGINGYTAIPSTEFAVGQQYAIPTTDINRARLEGAVAPDSNGVARSQFNNVTQIFQEKVKVTYTKQAANQQNSGLNIGGETNPITDELDFQTGVTMEWIANNLNSTLINQTYQKPVNNLSARKTRGLLQAITSTVLANAGVARAMTLSLLDDLMQGLIDQNAIADGDNVFVLANTNQMRKLNELFRADKIKFDNDRIVGGTRVRTVYSSFGVLNFVLERDMPQNVIAAVNFDALGLMATSVPNKGVLFREELAKTGATDDFQIYGELGLDHGPEFMHGKIIDLL